MFLVDTNILLDLADDDPIWAPWSIRTLEAAVRSAPIAINPIIFAELSIAYGTIEALDEALDLLEIRRLALPYRAGFLAGRAFLKYRQAGGLRRAPLPDFYIGAHAAVEGMDVISRDPKGIRTYFPSVRVISPNVDSPKVS